jgi:hypothetical protein
MSSIAIRRAQPAAPVTANTTNAQVFALASNSAIPVTIPVPGKLVLEGKKFTVRAEGNVFVSGAYTCLASIIAGLTIPATPFTIGNWTTLCAGTARACNSGLWAPWYIETDLQFDSLSGIMQGNFQQMINNLYNTPTVNPATLTGINGTNANVTQNATVVSPADPVCYIGVALTFGTGSATNVGNLYNFELGF